MVWVCVFLALGVFLVFGQTARFEFIDYDDNSNVYENQWVEKGLSWKGAAWALSHAQVSSWVPLTTLSHMLDCQVFGLRAGGHHLVNVLWQAANAILLFLALRQMTGNFWRSAFVAAVFALHPLRVESVAWVSERKDVLSAFFFFLTIGAYVRHARQPSRLGGLLVFLLFALGLLAKSMVATLPFVLLLLDYWPLERLREPRQFFPRVKEKLPLLALSLASCVAAASMPGLIISPGQRLPFFDRVSNAVVSYAVYLGQLVYPTRLAIPYPFPPNGQPAWKLGLALVLLAGISAGTFFCRKKRPYLLIGWLWYLGMLVPVIGFVQISPDAAHADRYTYLSEIGVVLAVTWAVAEWSAGWRHRRPLLAMAMMASLGALAVCCFVQTSYWKNNDSLWTHTLACTSGNYPAHHNLAYALAKQGKLDEAVAQYREALEIQPRYAETRYNLGIALSRQGKLDEAIAQYRAALEIAPAKTEARNNLGNALARQGSYPAAIVEYQKVLELDPDFADARYNLGNVFLKQHKLDEAIAQYRKTLEITPENAAALNNLGNALAMKGADDAAIAQYQRALEINSLLTDARQNLASLFLKQGKLDEAIAQYRKVLEIKPNDARVRDNLSKALLLKENR
jgi:tetratricopeptide (TPR) repeat protein